MKAGIVVFPGTNRERDMRIALRNASGREPVMLWHRDTELPELDLVVLPGGFSHGDYLRSGAMAAHAPIMAEVRRFAGKGGHVLGVCNGFQILTEAQMLPGALLRNAGMRFLSHDCVLRVEQAGTAFSGDWEQGARFRAPMAHGDGNFSADADTLDRIEGEGQVVFRYVDEAGAVISPNGSARGIAGVLSANRRVCGLMPHPEDMVDPLTGGEDGRPLFDGLVRALAA